MNVNKKAFDELFTTRKRPHEEDEQQSDDVKRREIENDRPIAREIERTEIRFDFVVENNHTEDGDLAIVQEQLIHLKQQLNDVKSRLSDKDIADWNRHTAYMNAASTIVPYLREKLNIEISTQAWAKMYEILASFPLITNVNNPKWLTLHLCEAPGAFISALNHFLVTQEETQYVEWQWFAQTLNPYYEHDQSTAAMLIDDDRLIFHSIDEHQWDFGMDNSGNLMNQVNIDHYISRFQPMGINFITADGSFDVQNNPAEQEHLVYPLLKTEVYIALSCLITHGNFVLKIFTIFEQITLDLIYLLYRTFRQISMFKPTTSKKGNSEMYVICIDFDRAKFTNCFTDQLEVIPKPYSSSFLNQILQCSQVFQLYQINTIEHNLHYFNNLTRKFSKKLHKIKDNTLNAFLDKCQVRELLINDRHLLKANLQSQRSHQRLTRTGTFNDQHQMDIQSKIREGFFCLTCSNIGNDNLCDTCQILCQIMDNRSLNIPPIYIGELLTDKQISMDCISGQPSINIRNSCFCNRYLLELCPSIPVSYENSIDFASIRKCSSREISSEQFEQLQRFAKNYQLEFQSQNGVYYIQSTPILTRLQASVIYILTHTFEQTSIYVIPVSSPHLLFLFQTSQITINEDYQTFPSSPTSTLLQFIHIHQLLDQQFAFQLIQANNICLQLKYITSIFDS